MAMRRQLLLTTAAAGLIIGGGIAAAQDRSTDDTMRSRPPAAAQSQQSKPDRATNDWPGALVRRPLTVESGAGPVESFNIRRERHGSQ
jgi:hypothetical protein